VCDLGNGATHAGPVRAGVRWPPPRDAGRRAAYNAAVPHPILRKKNPFAIDAQLPPRGPARWAAIVGLVVGGIVALLVPVFFAVMVIGLLRGG
jgi:hypothetical protein